MVKRNPMSSTKVPSEQGYESNTLISVAQMIELERAADAAGHSYDTMMARAGAAVARQVLRRVEPGEELLLLVGPGNNGGDGLVCAQQLQRAGCSVRVYCWRRQHDGGHVDAHLQRVESLGIPLCHHADDADFATLRTWLHAASLVVDALLGTGSNRPIGGDLATLLEHVHARQAAADPPFVVAVDCPSGMNCDTGAVDANTPPADVTVTFAHAKRGHYHFPGAAVCGLLHVADIGIPPQISVPDKIRVLTRSRVERWLPHRSPNSHKGSFGKVMLAVGSANYPGAAMLATAAAGRAGAGLVTGAVVEKIWPIAAARLPEPTWLPLPGGEGDASGAIAAAAAAQVAERLDGYSALVLGCGLGQAPTTVAFVRDLLAAQRPPTVIDADGLNCLSTLESWPDALDSQTILTPHAAEFSRLTQTPLETVLSQRWELARTYAAAWNVVLLVKGPYTVIAAPDGELAVLPVATPALATAGTGDVLSGIIGGLLAQGLGAFAAACSGAWIHGEAGLLCEREIGRAGVLASDLLERIPRVLAHNFVHLSTL